MRDPQSELATVHELEQARCRALAADDIAALRNILSSDLLHTHTRGNSDDFESYLAYIQQTIDILQVERAQLRLRHHGDAIVMTGLQSNIARLRGGDGGVVRVESKAVQVWVREADCQWRLSVFQATSLGPPIPQPANDFSDA